MIFIRSTLFALLVTLLTIPFGILVSIAMLGSLRLRYAIIAVWRHGFMALCRGVLGIRYQVIGRENMPATPSVILSKHQSAWETVGLQDIFPPLVFVLKKELLRIPFFGWGLSAMKMISIDRTERREALRQVAEQGCDRLQDGYWVVVFPEGTRVAPGERGRYKPGGAHLAAQAGVPVVPVAHNAGEVWSRNAFLKSPGLITVSIGPPIDTANLSELQVGKAAENWIEAEMRRISPHRYPDAAAD
ncbi:1-acyl-sn-glycerol-3-phosphate acyltransferase [Rhodocyclus tenuis]|uniref:1-acyl-sn-glycerol-3-phosphate acyltransferase n=2 Tax=Rhodocyclus TaxID=1064 RepID=A0A6L5JZE9_RHOTE|nr:lysophospholipid acyltransferase family protein [Rhodocyclus gracilis]MQY52697.1 1-acyl-sn-glycerol-3-phosphate acyltransferase [Rhodocyclus gracilis]MRD72764.1 1-acyl-sn-glycerol-3-phosphate acyltransferase [Rhodocyclus gracilis]NJA90170.1 1-acyl-sn-glycerol-3-phosphate acyltransferase [Rhodocyclus gracilis]